MTTFENSCNSSVNLFQNRFNRKKKLQQKLYQWNFVICNAAIEISKL